MSEQELTSLLVWCASGIIPAVIAPFLGRRPWVWLPLGLVLGLFATLLLLGMHFVARRPKAKASEVAPKSHDCDES